ncbi:MAG: 30S ribosomal protein S6 [Planctomycetes bacterium]|nr:30S ribosomal protein S6 [Planctomycetota bacterium]
MADVKERLYEGLFLVESNFANKDEAGAIALAKGVLEKHGANVVRCEKWAEQKLAYEIRKNKRGAYILAAFTVDPLKVSEIELECRLTERILRYLLVNRANVPIEKWFKKYEPAPRVERKEGMGGEPRRDRAEEAAPVAVRE